MTQSCITLLARVANPCLLAMSPSAVLRFELGGVREAKGKKPGAATAIGVSASCQYSTSRCNDSVMHRSFGQGGKSMLVSDVTKCGSPL